MTNKQNDIYNHQHQQDCNHDEDHEHDHHSHHEHDEEHGHDHQRHHEHGQHHHSHHEHDHEHSHHDWEEPGFVSLWLANISTPNIDDTLIEYLQIEYDQDGDVINPPFCSDFKIEEFDEDFREAGILDEPRHTLETLLDGCSYPEEVIPLFKKVIDPTLDLTQYNTVILLYNYNYKGTIKHVNKEHMKVVFMGSVQMKDEQ